MENRETAARKAPVRICNCHTHVFTGRNVPDEFLPFGLVRLLARWRFTRKLAWLLNRINPFSSDDLFDHYAAFLEIGSSPSQADVFERLRVCYPEGTRFVALMMDMEFMGAGTVEQGFLEQISELAALRQRYPGRLLPFVAADPRRRDVSWTVEEALEFEGFAGIKLYPALGYYPFDGRLANMYAYAEELRIPIIAHCSRGGIYYRGKITDGMLGHPKDPTWKLGRKPNSQFCAHFTDPRNYRYLLADFQKLKICLAHFGGDAEWERYLAGDEPGTGDECWVSAILELMTDERYPNVYADVSYVMHDERFHPLLKVMLGNPVVRERVLFGTDFYLVQLDKFEREYCKALQANLGEEDFRQIAEINPERFLARGT